MRITNLLLVAVTAFSITIQSAKAEGNQDFSVITETMTWSEIMGAMEGADDISTVIGSIAINNEQYLTDALNYVATNNPDALFEIMQIVRVNAPELAVDTLVTITQLLADNTVLLERIQNDNQALVAEILNRNSDVEPAAGPVGGDEGDDDTPPALPVPNAENSRQSSPS